MKIVLALWDSRAETYMQPFFVPAIGVAIRNLQDELQRGGDDNILAKHPHDFKLYQLAVYDDETGLIEPSDKPLHICEVASLMPEQENAKQMQLPMDAFKGVTKVLAS